MSEFRSVNYLRKAALVAQVTWRRQGACELCGGVGRLTAHHLKPAEKLGRRHRFNLMNVCRDCHDDIHRFFTNEELAAHFRNPAALLVELGFRSLGRKSSREEAA